MQSNSLALRSQTVGSLPIIQHILDTLHMREILTRNQSLQAYKYQPHLEKRHSLFKSLLEVSPVFLKKNTRIEAFIFVYWTCPKKFTSKLLLPLHNTLNEKLEHQSNTNPSACPKSGKSAFSKCGMRALSPVASICP
jgi:transposase